MCTLLGTFRHTHFADRGNFLTFSLLFFYLFFRSLSLNKPQSCVSLTAFPVIVDLADVATKLYFPSDLHLALKHLNIFIA